MGFEVPVWLLVCLVAIFFLLRKPASAYPGICRVSLLDRARFWIADVFPYGRGQAPFLRSLHRRYGSPACQIGSLISFAPSADAARDAVLFKAIAKLPKSARVYQCFDVSIQGDNGHTVSHSTIFTTRDVAQWRIDHKKAAPLFRVLAVREKQNVVWQTLEHLTARVDALLRNSQEEVTLDSTTLLRAFAVDVTCLWLVQTPYGALENLDKNIRYTNPDLDIGPILNMLNREFGWSYNFSTANARWQAFKAWFEAKAARLGVGKTLLQKWQAESASMRGWAAFVEKAVKAGHDPPGSFSDHFASVMLDGSSSKIAQDALSAQIFDGIFAGTDTLTLVLSFSLYILASPATSVRVAIARIKKELPPAPWLIQDLENLPWLTATVRECLRLADANPHILERVVVSEGAEDLPMPLSILPQGMRVGVAGYVAHRSTAAFGDHPDAFFPRRWLPTSHADHALPPGTLWNADDLHTAYMPFGRSPRACIAQSFASAVVTATLATWISKYSFEQRGPTHLVEKGWRDCFNKVINGDGRVAIAVRMRKE